LKRRHS